MFFDKLTFVLSYSIKKLLRLNDIFMVRKIDKKSVGGGGVFGPSTLPLSNFRTKMVGPS